MCVVFHDWLLFLNILRFVHVVSYINTSFLLPNNILFYGNTTFSLSIPLDGPLSCFHYLAVMNNAANECGCTSYCINIWFHSS